MKRRNDTPGKTDPLKEGYGPPAPDRRDARSPLVEPDKRVSRHPALPKTYRLGQATMERHDTE